jgi:hypothetical protein
MQEPDGLNSEQLELERALRSLSPARAQIDPIAAAFEAGRKVRQRQVRAWASAFVALLVIMTSMLLWILQPSTRVRRTIDGSNSAVRAQPRDETQNSPHVAVVSFEQTGHRMAASSQGAQKHLPIRDRILVLPPQPPPSLMILQQSIEKQGFDGMPTTYLPDAGELNDKNPM